MHRFTEELFAVLIAFIFIFNAVQNLFKVAMEEQFVPKTTLGEIGCSCKYFASEFENMTKEDCVNNNGTLVGDDCEYHPNVFLMVNILHDLKSQEIPQRSFLLPSLSSCSLAPLP